MMVRTADIQNKLEKSQGVEALLGARTQAKGGPKTEAELLRQFGDLLDKIASHLSNNSHLADKTKELPPGLLGLSESSRPGVRGAPAQKPGAQPVPVTPPVAEHVDHEPQREGHAVEQHVDHKEHEERDSDHEDCHEQAESEDAPAVAAEPIVAQQVPAEVVPAKIAQADSTDAVEPASPDEPTEEVQADCNAPVPQVELATSADAPVAVKEGVVDADANTDAERAVEPFAPMEVEAQAVVANDVKPLAAKVSKAEVAPAQSFSPANPAAIVDESAAKGTSDGVFFATDDIVKLKALEEISNKAQLKLHVESPVMQGSANGPQEVRVAPEQLMTMLIQQAAQKVLGPDNAMSQSVLKSVETALKAPKGVEGLAQAQNNFGREQAENSIAKKAERGLGLDKEKSAKLLNRVSAFRTMEKVENALGEVAKSKNGSSISIDLDPVNLGKVKVDVTLKDGVLFARVVAQSNEVSEFLRNRAGDLQAALKRLGLKVDEVHVNVSGNSGWNFGEELGNKSDKSASVSGQRSDSVSVADEEVDTLNTAVVSGAQAQVTDHWVA